MEISVNRRVLFGRQSVACWGLIAALLPVRVLRHVFSSSWQMRPGRGLPPRQGQAHERRCVFERERERDRETGERERRDAGEGEGERQKDGGRGKERERERERERRTERGRGRETEGERGGGRERGERERGRGKDGLWPAECASKSDGVGRSRTTRSCPGCISGGRRGVS